MASPKCLVSMWGEAARSAMVRETFRMRSWARAESPRREMADSRSFSPSAKMVHCLRNLREELFVFQRNHRIDARSSQRGNEGSDERDNG